MFGVGVVQARGCSGAVWSQTQCCAGRRRSQNFLEDWEATQSGSSPEPSGAQALAAAPETLTWQQLGSPRSTETGRSWDIRLQGGFLLEGTGRGGENLHAKFGGRGEVAGGRAPADPHGEEPGADDSLQVEWWWHAGEIKGSVGSQGRQGWPGGSKSQQKSWKPAKRPLLPGHPFQPYWKSTGVG